MSSTVRATGLERFPTADRAELCAARPYHVSSGERRDVLQPIWTIHDQGGLGSCVGHALAAGIESLDPALWRAIAMVHTLRTLTLSTRSPLVSAVQIWTDARRRQGDLARPDRGTWFETAVESVIRRGWSRYVPREDETPLIDLAQIPDLRSEMEAADHQVDSRAEHHAIEGDRLGGVIDALDRGLVVGMGGGRKDPFFYLGKDEIATTYHVGGDRNGHEERIVGYFATPNLLLVQGSWGTGAFGCTIPNDVTISDGSILRRGTFIPGCYLMHPECLEDMWAIDCVKIEYA